MKKILVASFALTALFFVSCQKEVSEEIGGNPGTGGGGTGGGTTGTKLVKTVHKDGADSTVIVYGYDANNKVISATTSGVSGGQPIDLRINLTRNSAGVITKQVIRSNDFIAFGIDSLVTQVRWDATNNRYKNAVSHISIFGFDITDSITYNYDAGGKLTSEVEYQDDGMGGPMAPSTKREYTYTGSNIVTEKAYNWDDATNAYVLSWNSTYEYDTKVNPTLFATDAPVLGMSDFYPANNVTKDTFVDNEDPTNNYVETSTYTYNSSNRPITGTVVNNGSTSTTTYTYQ